MLELNISYSHTGNRSNKTHDKSVSIDRLSEVAQSIISAVQYVLTLYENNPYLNEILKQLCSFIRLPIFV